MRSYIVFACIGFLMASVVAKDGHGDVSPPGAKSGTYSMPSRTYYSYSYHAPGSSPKPPVTSTAPEYLHKGASTVDSYKGVSSKSRNWSATDTVNGVSSRVTKSIPALKK